MGAACQTYVAVVDDDESECRAPSASTGSITGALGGYTKGWVTKRLIARADHPYIKVKLGDSEASVTDWRLGADYYFFRNAGLGGQVTFQGGQIFLTFLF